MTALHERGIEQLFRLLGHFEQGPDGGPALTAYLCPAGKWTLSYGCTKHPDGSPVQEGDTITQDQVYPYVEAAVARVLADVRSIVKRPLNMYQEAALCSFVFNLGGDNLRTSTQLLPAIEAGRWEDASEAMSEFIRAWGRRENRWYRMAMLGLLIRRYAEGLLLLGLDWAEACNAEHIGLPRERKWQPDWVDPEGKRTGGRFYDIILPGRTEFTIIHEMAKSDPLPPIDMPIQAEPAPNPAGKAEQPREAQPPTQAPPSAASAPVSKPATPSVVPPAQASPASSPKPTVAPSGSNSALPPLTSVRVPPGEAQAPVAPPKPPPVPVPIGQQTSAVDATRNANEWSNSPKAMIFSRRFWGLFLVLIGRLWMLKTGSNAVLGAVSDPLIMEMFSGFMVMVIGELVQHWGERKAKRLLY